MGSDPCAPLIGGLESSSSCDLVKISFTGSPCIKMCQTPPWFLLLQALSLVWPLWGEIKGIFLLQGCPPMAQSQTCPSHPSPTFCLSSNLSLLGSSKPQTHKISLFLHSAPGSPWGLRAQVAPIPPRVCPLCRDREPRCQGCVQRAVPWLWPRGMLTMTLCSPLLIAGPGQLVKGSALCPAVLQPWDVPGLSFWGHTSNQLGVQLL